MRLRHVKNAREIIQSNPQYILDNIDNKRIDVTTLFDNDQPIHIEIGMGKGQFIYNLAKENKDINYIGIEKFDSAIVKGLFKVLDEPQENLMLIRTDATDLLELFDEKTISRIYLNFSDPWPKERHAKRRLTHKNFLSKYEKLLTKNSEIHQKTDNDDLFTFSVESMLEYGMDILFQTRNLHKEDVPNIMTEFEEKFSKKGIKINKLIATFKEEING